MYIAYYMYIGLIRYRLKKAVAHKPRKICLIQTSEVKPQSTYICTPIFYLESYGNELRCVLSEIRNLFKNGIHVNLPEWPYYAHDVDPLRKAS